ncbi:uncharacterized protein LOC109607923 isoform X2 [Aethina tumida]|uniref:uncharacterized protein LOC109607923 isoform X2 n=1 Tax=Aethina tumida TaxID=116153 RepID=UPI00096B1C02|nr:uncharacterized protein LOC109607923 isoform X2 [Aethina tumida]
MSRKTELKSITAEDLNVFTEEIQQLWEQLKSKDLEPNTAKKNAKKMKYILNFARESMDFHVLVCNSFKKFPSTSVQEAWNFCRVTLDKISRECAILEQAGASLSRQAENKSHGNGDVSK